jgi:tetratricopeptide (TPR) repeat protein
VEKTAGLVTHRKHVALIGLGGIGKTSVSKMALNDPLVIEYFSVARYFISCDGFVLSLEAFLGRIAQAVGATITSSNPLASLSAFLSSRTTPILIVLDNAESVLDAGGTETQAQITQAIEEIGSWPSVSLILTTRTASIPTNVRWNRVTVPPLDMDAARDAFSAVYEYERPSATVDLLLQEVGCHALSINLLAVAGAQNEWSIAELHQRWQEEKTRVLDLEDNNRMQSLAASIDLSLKSPTLGKLGDKALEVLQVVAFLPQGVDQTNLQELFPSVPNIQRISDTMKRLSLTYISDAGFITMLAPIRIHVQSSGPFIPSLLPDVRSFYFNKLENTDVMRVKWITSENDNVERLVAHSMDTTDDLERAVKACDRFLYVLYWNKPRTTTLTPIVRALNEVDGITIWKGKALRTLGWLAEKLGRYEEATELFGSARQVAITHGHASLAAECSFFMGQTELTQNRFLAAERFYQNALKEYQSIKDEDGVARCQERLGNVETRRGNLPEASRYLSDALKYREREPGSREAANVRVRLGGLEFKQGNHAEGREHFEAALTIFTKLDVDQHLAWCLWEYARAEQASNDWASVLDLFGRAETFYHRANDVRYEARCLLERGQIFLYQRKLALAQQCFEQAKGGYEKAGRAHDIANCQRGLGEVAYLQKENERAERLFAEAKSLYDSMKWKPFRQGVQLQDDLRWDY